MAHQRKFYLVMTVRADRLCSEDHVLQRMDKAFHLCPVLLCSPCCSPDSWSTVCNCMGFEMTSQPRSQANIMNRSCDCLPMSAQVGFKLKPAPVFRTFGAIYLVLLSCNIDIAVHRYTISKLIPTVFL